MKVKKIVAKIELKNAFDRSKTIHSGLLLVGIVFRGGKFPCQAPALGPLSCLAAALGPLASLAAALDPLAWLT